MSNTPTFAAQAAKAELHCHTDALLDATMLRELGPAALRAELSPDELEGMCPATSWDHWITNYGTRVDAVMTRQLFLATLDRHIRRLRTQNVVYTDLFVSGWLLLREPEEKSIAVFRAARETIEAAGEGKIRVGLMVGLGRGPRERAEKQFARVMALRREGLICGVAIAADESACTIESIHDLLDKARETRMGIEIHAGEQLGPECVREAIEWGRPDRLGHGLAAFTDETLVEEIIRLGIHVEFCPTSNAILTPYKDLRNHPLVRARELGLSYSINTDDPAPFTCSMNSEFARLEWELGFGPADFDRILRQSLAAGFAGR
ncbi:MAG: hypothetical protein KKB51_21855 [Candidatus Riflebacteria bacterium]|nr:hypothetical protein [Candidatus Riflebacteria bacterium]